MPHSALEWSEANGLVAHRAHRSATLEPRSNTANSAHFGAERRGTSSATDLKMMAHVDPSITHRPEFADTQPDMRTLLNPKAPTTLQRVKQGATPFLIGAGVGASLAAVVVLASSKKQPSFTLFPVAKSTMLGSVAKVALLAVGRGLLRRAFAHAVEQAATRAA